MPLVINNLRGGHTHIHMHTDVHTETILRNQVHIGLRPAHAWYNFSSVSKLAEIVIKH